MAFQILACILLGFFGGMKLDAWLGFVKVPIFTLVLGLLGVVFGIYISIKDFLKK
jgi:Putative F0F1-ATPase subunit Ca2+/Mg2+ transporter